MPKWVRKAKSLGHTSSAVSRQWDSTKLREIIDESRRSLCDLQFVMQHTAFSGTLTCDAKGLAVAEAFCRDNDAWLQRKDAFSDETIHRLLALFVGHVFEETGRGKWTIYPGKYHISHPIVIELASMPKSFVQPFLYCNNLRTNMHLQGARFSKSLTILFDNPEKCSTR